MCKAKEITTKIKEVHVELVKNHCLDSKVEKHLCTQVPHWNKELFTNLVRSIEVYMISRLEDDEALFEYYFRKLSQRIASMSTTLSTLLIHVGNPMPEDLLFLDSAPFYFIDKYDEINKELEQSFDNFIKITTEESRKYRKELFSGK